MSDKKEGYIKQYSHIQWFTYSTGVLWLLGCNISLNMIKIIDCWCWTSFLNIQGHMGMLPICSNGYITTHSTASLNYSTGTQDIAHHDVIV